MLDRAMASTEVAVVITDPLGDDNPVVWCNPAFSRLTGYLVCRPAGLGKAPSGLPGAPDVPAWV